MVDTPVDVGKFFDSMDPDNIAELQRKSVEMSKLSRDGQNGRSERSLDGSLKETLYDDNDGSNWRQAGLSDVDGFGKDVFGNSVVRDDVSVDKSDKSLNKKSGGRTGSKSVSKSNRSSSKNISDKNQFNSVIRNIPKAMIDGMRVDFPGADTQTDLVVAYVMTHCSDMLASKVRPFMTESQVALVSNWKGDSTTDSRNKLDDILAKLDSFSHSISVLELLLSFVVYDRMGLRHQNPKQISDIDFLESGVMDIVVQGEKQAVKMRREKNVLLGRPRNPNS